MEVTEIHALLRGKFSHAIGEEIAEGRDWPILDVEGARIIEVCAFLREEEALDFDCLSNLSGVDQPADEKIEVDYHLFSYTHRHQLTLRTTTPRLDPVLQTACLVWPAANWLERECFDLLGVRFLGHPDMRRILMPEDWVGHPLRKDFVEPDEYHGISTRRESLLKL
ncbi:MAG: NADH-quinone oxidoreductase subunit C [Deltaproteobacteria bacterium]